MSEGVSEGVSDAATVANLAEQLESALNTVTAELQAGDVVAAATAVQSLVAMCQSTRGQVLSPEQLARLRGQLEQCTILAGTTEVELNIAMQKFNQGGRARKAYGDV